MLVHILRRHGVNLGAVPGPGSVFVGWTGGGLFRTAGCSVKLNADVTGQRRSFRVLIADIGTSQTIKYGSSLAGPQGHDLSTGQPIAGAQVSLWRRSSAASSWSYVASRTTSATG